MVEDDETSEPEMAAQKALAASSLGPLAQRQESIAQILVEDGPDGQLQKLTHFFSRQEPLLYARLEYILRLTDAVEKQDAEGFRFPPLDDLLRADMRLRTSHRQQTRKILESITKIFERGDGGGSGRGGFLGRRRG